MGEHLFAACGWIYKEIRGTPLFVIDKLSREILSRRKTHSAITVKHRVLTKAMTRSVEAYRGGRRTTQESPALDVERRPSPHLNEHLILGRIKFLCMSDGIGQGPHFIEGRSHGFPAVWLDTMSLCRVSCLAHLNGHFWDIGQSPLTSGHRLRNIYRQALEMTTLLVAAKVKAVGAIRNGGLLWSAFYCPCGIMLLKVAPHRLVQEGLLKRRHLQPTWSRVRPYFCLTEASENQSRCTPADVRLSPLADRKFLRQKYLAS